MRLSVKKAMADSVSRWLQKYLDTTNILQYLEEEFARFDFWFADLSRRSWSPGPSAASYVAVDGPPGPSMAAMDGPLCRKWFPCSKLEKQWLQLQIDLYVLTGEFEVTIKIFKNNAMHVCCNSESSLAAKTTFFLLTHSRIVIWATTS